MIRPLTAGRQAGEFHKDRKDGKGLVKGGGWVSQGWLRAYIMLKKQGLEETAAKIKTTIRTGLRILCRKDSLPNAAC